MAFNIAIDGPAGAGKSTIAKNIAKKLQFVYVDTGAMYRAMAYFFIVNKININDEMEVQKKCADISIELSYENNQQKVILNNKDITSQLRTEEVGNAASIVAVYAEVRRKLVELQQEIAKTTNVVMDGRDIGTQVLPNATLKIYLTASVGTRASRRYQELILKGENPSLKMIEKDIESRDARDMNRKVSPLKQAMDAILVDSSNMTIQEVSEHIISLFENRSV